jgi:hypothetical protein
MSHMEQQQMLILTESFSPNAYEYCCHRESRNMNLRDCFETSAKRMHVCAAPLT